MDQTLLFEQSSMSKGAIPLGLVSPLYSTLSPMSPSLPWLVCEEEPMEACFSPSIQFPGLMAPLPYPPVLPMMGPQGIPPHMLHLMELMQLKSATFPPQQQKLNPNAKPFTPPRYTSTPHKVTWGHPSSSQYSFSHTSSG